MSRKELQPEDITAICDTREQTPLDLAPLKVEPGTLPTGDYTIKGLERVISVERKSLQDLVMCVGRERERFEREMLRLAAYPVRLLVVEATLGAIELHQYRGEVNPNAVLSSLLGWSAAGVPHLLCPDHTTAGKMVARFMFIAARRRWREAQVFVDNLRIAT
jgi:DNA excision repair protein ERCC-4